VPLDRDGDFTWDLFIERYNTELANDLGNLVSRTVAMAVKYFGGDLPATAPEGGPEAELAGVAETAVADYRAAFERLAVHEAIGAAWTILRRANQVIEETAPWALAKDESQRDRLAGVMNALLESVRLAALLLAPIMPEKTAGIRERIRMEAEPTLDDARWDPAGFRPAGTLEKPAPLFPRIEAES
jgi:methionyl-tRNA synthetase